jgi:hypothetical protein
VPTSSFRLPACASFPFAVLSLPARIDARETTETEEVRIELAADVLFDFDKADIRSDVAAATITPPVLPKAAKSQTGATLTRPLRTLAAGSSVGATCGAHRNELRPFQYASERHGKETDRPLSSDEARSRSRVRLGYSSMQWNIIRTRSRNYGTVVGASTGLPQRYSPCVLGDGRCRFGSHFNIMCSWLEPAHPQSPATLRVSEPVRGQRCAAVLLRRLHAYAWEFIKNIAAQVGSKDEPWSSMH